MTQLGLPNLPVPHGRQPVYAIHCLTEEDQIQADHEALDDAQASLRGTLATLRTLAAAANTDASKDILRRAIGEMNGVVLRITRAQLGLGS